MLLSRIILGFLAIAPMTGADLKRHFDTTVSHFWSADKAQIYRTLAALVEGELATSTVVRGIDTPDRHEHRITPAGRAALDAWLTSELDRQPNREAFLARIFLSDTLGDADVAALVARRRATAHEQLAALEALGSSAPSPATRGERLRLATLDNGLRHLRAELDWLDSLECLA